jgi:hypothetical protein
MYYPDGQKMKVGDLTKLWSNSNAVVVADIDEKKWLTDAEEGWICLGTGIMIFAHGAGYMHYTSPDPGFEFIRVATDEDKIEVGLRKDGKVLPRPK